MNMIDKDKYTEYIGPCTYEKQENLDLDVGREEHTYPCLDCRHVNMCIKDFGPYRADGDDYRAVAGTHFCRKSWDDFKCCGCRDDSSQSVQI